MDLKLVQTITSGMRDVNRRSAELAGDGSSCPGGVVQPRPVVHPAARYEPRPVIHPRPRIEPRKVITLQPRVVEAAPPAIAAPQAPEKPAEKSNPIQPPWRILPWNTPVPLPPRNVIKPIVRPVDNVRKGSMLDLFI